MRRIALLTALALLGVLEMPAGAKASRTVEVTGWTDAGHKLVATVDGDLRITKLHVSWRSGCEHGVVDLDHLTLQHEELRTEGYTQHRHFAIHKGFGPMEPPLTDSGSYHHRFGFHGTFHVSRDGHARIRVHSSHRISQFGCSGLTEHLSAEYVKHLHGRTTANRSVSVTVHGGLAVTDGGLIELASPACPNDRHLRVSLGYLHDTRYTRGTTWETKREVLADGTRHVVSHAEWSAPNVGGGQLTLSAWEDPQGHVRVHGIAHLRAFSREYRRYCEGTAEFWLPGAAN